MHSSILPSVPKFGLLTLFSETIVKDTLNAIRADPAVGSFITFDRLRAALPDSIASADAEAVLGAMQDANMIMYRDGLIILI